MLAEHAQAVRCGHDAHDAFIVPMNTSNTMKRPRDHISARLDHDVLEVVQQVAEDERRPVSSVVRNVLTDWAKARGSETQGQMT